MREIKIRAWDNELKEMLYSKTDWQFFYENPGFINEHSKETTTTEAEFIKSQKGEEES